MSIAELSAVRQVVDNLPYMTMEMALKIDHLLTRYRLKNCLELGFYHGVSSAYIASILRKNGGGKLTTIDRINARELKPNIDKILAALNLQSYVEVYYEERSYSWRLMKMLERNPRAYFDFCYIDGGHSWDNTGFAFFLVEKLLKPGAWLILDDLDWTFKSMEKRAGRDAWFRQKPREEITTPQVRKVWELLIKPHPAFCDFREEGQWAFARKR